MNVARFVAVRESDWSELEHLVAEAGGAPQDLGAARIRRLGELYRGAAADLALARLRFPSDPVIRRLEGLVTRARPAVYVRMSGRRGATSFFVRGYWRRVAERPALLLIAWSLLLAPAALAFAWGVTDPGAAIGVVPKQFQPAAQPSGPRESLTPEQQSAFSALVFTNNIQVSFLAFAGGIAVGLGTVAVLLYNGLLLGSVLGVATSAGNGGTLIAFVAAHGVLELSCIAVTSAAGLRLGWAIVDPGPRRRSRALAEEALGAVEIVLGTVPWFVLAGVVEAFVSRSTTTVEALILGFGLGAIFWLLVIWRGRDTHGSRELYESIPPR